MDNKRVFHVVLMEPAEQQIPSTIIPNDLNGVSYCDQCNSDSVILWFLVNMYAALVVVSQMLKFLQVNTTAAIRRNLHIVIDQGQVCQSLLPFIIRVYLH